MALKFKNQKKPEKLVDRYMAILAQKSRYMGNYEVLQHTRTMKRLTNIVWAVKTQSCYLNASVCRSGGVLLSFKREPDGSSSTWILRNLSL